MHLFLHLFFFIKIDFLFVIENTGEFSIVFHVFEMSLMENKCLKCQFPSLESAVSRRASCQLLAKMGTKCMYW